MAELHGVDISEFQSSTPTGYDFYIMRATYGGESDSMMSTHLAKVQSWNKPFGFYHFAYPQLNPGNSGAEAEADAFLTRTQKYAKQCIYALDVEGRALNVGTQTLVSWILHWLDYVYSKTGSRPLLYIQGSAAQSVALPVFRNNYGIWAASDPSWYDNMNIAIQQSVYGGLDHDTFYGDLDQWNAYCDPSGASKPTPGEPSQPVQPEKPDPATPGTPVEKPAVDVKPKPAQPIVKPRDDTAQVLYYIVQKGDTLTSIAGKYGTTWQVIYAANKKVIGDNPDLIYPGQRLLIQKPSAQKDSKEYYTIQKGDTLYDIAQKYHTTIHWLQTVNAIENPDLIYAGDMIRVK